MIIMMNQPCVHMLRSMRVVAQRVGSLKRADS